MARKKFQDLNLADAFLFAAALSDADTCKVVLEILLGKSIGSVSVNGEHSMLFSSDCRSIRLDIYADDEDGNHYNVEMQGENEGNLPKRSRFHQAEMDVLELKPGEDFRVLEPNYVLFICCFDPFGKGLFRYTFTNRCSETELDLEDGTVKLFFNTKGNNTQEVSAELVHFLRYVENSTDECAEELADEVVGQLHERIKTLKRSREWRRKYMRFEELLQKEHNSGYEAGMREGHEAGMREGHEVGYMESENRMQMLILKMAEAGEGDKVALLSDRAFLQEMYRKYEV